MQLDNRMICYPKLELSQIFPVFVEKNQIIKKKEKKNHFFNSEYFQLIYFGKIYFSLKNARNISISKLQRKNFFNKQQVTKAKILIR